MKTPATRDEQVEQAYVVISACTTLLQKFCTDDDSGNEIPEEVKNNFIRGSLLSAIDIAAKQMLSQIT